MREFRILNSAVSTGMLQQVELCLTISWKVWRVKTIWDAFEFAKTSCLRQLLEKNLTYTANSAMRRLLVEQRVRPSRAQEKERERESWKWRLGFPICKCACSTEPQLRKHPDRKTQKPFWHLKRLSLKMETRRRENLFRGSMSQNYRVQQSIESNS